MVVAHLCALGAASVWAALISAVTGDGPGWAVGALVVTTAYATVMTAAAYRWAYRRD